jgi:carbon-monoxide dehydrogenase medium subunit
MDTKVEIYKSPETKKDISLADYINKNDRPLITKIIVPGRKNFYISICRYTRTSNDLALINIALGLELEGGICKDARFAIGGVAATPVRLTQVENILKDQKIDGKLLYISNKLREEVEKHINPIDDLRGKAWFKKELAGGLAVEALYKAAKKGGIEL